LKLAHKLCYYAYYPCQLFDLEADPEETKDLAGDPNYVKVIEELEDELRQIVDPERVSLICRLEQLDKLEQHGGYRTVLRNGPQFTESPVPKEFH
jgi:choline-sulfatase